MSDVEVEDRLADEAEEPARRHLPPVLYPVLAVAFGGVLVFSLSRILLAVSEIESVDLGIADLSGKALTAAIALFIALNLLVGAALVASGRRVRNLPASWPLLVGAGVVVVAGGFGALAVGGEEEGGGAEGEVQNVAIVASDIAFDTDRIALEPEVDVAMAFDNQDAGVPHNVAIYSDDTATQVVFQGEITTGVAQITYRFPAPQEGEYYFRCDVHPNMEGTVTVAPGAQTGGQPGGEPTPGATDGGETPTPTEPPAPGGEAVTLDISANQTRFDKPELAVPAGAAVTIAFTNEEALPHNVSVYTDESAAEAIFSGDIVTGPTTVDYTFDAPAEAGEYYFRCDVHPTEMEGVFRVQ